MINNSEFVWSQKYRPKTVEDCVLPDHIMKLGLGILEKGELPNMTLSGEPGVGKTTFALALAEQLGYEVMSLNGSGKDRGIAAVNDKMTQFASTMSMDGGRKVIIVDEGDNMTQDAQLALRSLIETVSANCAFIITCNYASRLDPAILSRCTNVVFTFPKEERDELMIKFFKKMATILKTENVEFDKEALLMLIKNNYPEFRTVVNQMQHAALRGKLSKESIKSPNSELRELAKLVAASGETKNYSAVRKWVAEMSFQPRDVITFFANTDLYADQSSFAQATVDGSEHDFNAAFVADGQINLLSYLIKLSVKCKFDGSK